MWGRVVKDSLETRFTIYQTVYVGILSFRTAVVSGSLLNQPSIGGRHGKGSSFRYSRLIKTRFFHYLWWLLNGRAVDVDEFKIAPGSRLGFSLFGTSDTTGSVISKTFSTYGELEMWADEALRRLLSTGDNHLKILRRCDPRFCCRIQ